LCLNEIEDIILIMNNRYCISNTLLKELWSRKNRNRLNNQILKFENLSLSEMTTQMENDEGAFYEAMTEDTNKFSAITQNAEILLATDLSEFYFPKIETEICFEMKRNFSAPPNISYDEITANIENDTYIDCSIKSNEKQFDFQIKRYAQKYFLFTSEAMSEFIIKVIRGYGDMSKTILIVLLQPDKEPKDHFDFKEIHDNICAIKNEISFEEINFVFNDEYQHLIWWQIFPAFGLAKKPLVFTSEKYQKVQAESKRKLENK